MNLEHVLTVLTDQRDQAERRRKEAAIRADNLRANMETSVAAVNRETALRDEYQTAIQILSKDDRPTLKEADPPEDVDDILYNDEPRGTV